MKYPYNNGYSITCYDQVDKFATSFWFWLWGWIKRSFEL
jgi:hypothetical protein